MVKFKREVNGYYNTQDIELWHDYHQMTKQHFYKGSLSTTWVECPGDKRQDVNVRDYNNVFGECVV